MRVCVCAVLMRVTVCDKCSPESYREITSGQAVKLPLEFAALIFIAMSIYTTTVAKPLLIINLHVKLRDVNINQKFEFCKILVYPNTISPGQQHKRCSGRICFT